MHASVLTAVHPAEAQSAGFPQVCLGMNGTRLYGLMSFLSTNAVKQQQEQHSTFTINTHETTVKNSTSSATIKVSLATQKFNPGKM